MLHFGRVRRLDGDEAGVRTGASKIGSGQKSTYIERTVVDSWVHGHQHDGGWRGYGGCLKNGKSQVSRRLEPDSYTDTRDMIGSNNATPASKTKTLFAGDFYLK